jgi:hypothetical protein
MEVMLGEPQTELPLLCPLYQGEGMTADSQGFFYLMQTNNSGFI